MHENAEISDLTLQLILYNLYSYGPDEWLWELLEAIKDLASNTYNLPVYVESHDGVVIHFRLVGVYNRVEFSLAMVFMRSMPQDVILATVDEKIFTQLQRGG